MADLTSISATDPVDGEAVSQGASRIRGIVNALLTSFGVEHALGGAHKFPFGASASRPAAGNAGRLFGDTTNRRLERDDGAGYRLLSAVQIADKYSVSAAVLTSAYSTVQTVTTDIPADARVLAIASFVCTNSALLNYQFRVGTTVVLPGADQAFTSTPFGTITVMGLALTPTTGSQAVTLEAKAVTGDSGAIVNPWLVALVL